MSLKQLLDDVALNFAAGVADALKAEADAIRSHPEARALGSQLAAELFGRPADHVPPVASPPPVVLFRLPPGYAHAPPPVTGQSRVIPETLPPFTRLSSPEVP